MKKILRAVILLPLFFVFSCNKTGNPVNTDTPNTPAGGKISTGQTVDLGSQTFGTSGGSFTISRPGDPLNGFQITVPQNGFGQTQTISVTYAPITSHQFGSNVNPVSPLVKITSGGGYSSGNIKIKVPIKLPAGSFAMAFFYDEASGTLEPLPLASLDSTSITISTRHLSPSDAVLGKSLGKRTQSVWGNLFVSSINESILHIRPMISSGFTPGQDDWEFPNYGSYIAPAGHCAGQSTTAMWYYYEQKLKGRPYLFHLYDKITDPNRPDSLWCDNPLGYRFASTIQEDMNFDTWIKDLDREGWVPNLVFDSFALAMLITGEPQLVLIRNSTTGAGHAMVVYKIDLIGNKLYIADPNYPNNRNPHTGDVTERSIQFVPGLLTGSFNPYSSAMVAGGDGTVFDQIGYAAKTSHIDWAKISARWAEFLAGTIGNDRFPTYTLIDNRTGAAFVDRTDTDRDTIKFRVQCATTPFWLSGTANLQPVDAYDEAGKYLKSHDRSGVLSLWLKPGDNKFGLYFRSYAADTHNHFVDFKWVTVHRHLDLSIASNETDRAPLSVPGVKNRSYSFIAKSAQPVPSDGKVKYTWTFGDGTAAVSVNNDSVSAHTYTTEGSYTVGVSLYYDATLITQASAQAVIAPPPAPSIKSITPASAKIGDTVVVAGKNFGLDQTKGTVTFSNGIPATVVTKWIDTTIAVKVPQGAITGSVTLTVNGLVSNAVTFTVATGPSIGGVNPSYASVGDTVTIDGNAFGTDVTKGLVQFTGASVQGTASTSWTNTRIKVVVPSGVATGPLVVIVSGVASNQVTFTLNAIPAITSVSPTTVSYGTPVHIYGKNFGSVQGVSTIKFGSLPPKSVVSWKDNEIVATAPELFMTSDAIILTINGSTYRTTTIQSMSPQITSVKPDTAYAQEPVTIRGKWFGYEQGAARLIFSYVDTALVTSWSDTLITAVVPDPSSHNYGAIQTKVLLGNTRYGTYGNFVVTEEVLETLHRTTSVDMSIRAVMTVFASPGGNKTKDNSYTFSTMGYHSPLSWSGTSFHISVLGAASYDTTTVTIDGKVSDDGKTILTMTGRYTVVHTLNVNVYHHSDVTELVFQNVPLVLSTPSQNSVGYGKTGAATSACVASIKFVSTSDGATIGQYISTDWTNATQSPFISVNFR